MQRKRKVTVELPAELLEKAQEATGTGITDTIRTALQILATSASQENVRHYHGKVHFTYTWQELKEDL